MRSLTAVETASLLALGGALVLTALPTFVSNLHASRLIEPIDGLSHIATRATAIAAGRAAEVAYPASVGLTPEQVPRAQRATDPPGTWDHPTWRQLGFGWTIPHSFSFSFESHNQPGEARFKARAHGDLDGDGVFSTFEIAGQSKDGSQPLTYPMSIYREVE